MTKCWPYNDTKFIQWPTIHKELPTAFKKEFALNPNNKDTSSCDRSTFSDDALVMWTGYWEFVQYMNASTDKKGSERRGVDRNNLNRGQWRLLKTLLKRKDSTVENCAFYNWDYKFNFFFLLKQYY